MGRDKSLLEVRGVALTASVATALKQAGAIEVLTVGGDLERLQSLDGVDRAVPDLHPGEGPLGGILSAFAAATEDVVVVLACDTPDITADAPRRLVEAIQATPWAGVAHAVFEGRMQPLTAAWRVSAALGPIRDAFIAGERAPRAVMATLPHVAVDGFDERAVADVDRPEDLHRYARTPRTSSSEDQ